MFNWELEIEKDTNPRRPWRDFYNWYNSDEVDEPKFTLQYDSGESVLCRSEIVAIEVKKLQKKINIED